MNIVNITLGVDTQPCSSITLGRRGENEVTQVAVDFSSWVEEFGAGVITLLAMRSQDTSAYPVVLSLDGNTATWDVTSTDTAYKGSGRAEYIYTVGEQIAKSVVFNTVVMQDIGEPSETPPDPYEDWLERLTELGAETQANAQAAEQSAEDAAESAQQAAESAASIEGDAQQAEEAARLAQAAIGYMPKIVDGDWWVYDAETETWADTGIRAEGRDGVGISGAVLNADYTLTLTFSDGTSYTTPSIRGKQGEPGKDGDPGKDGKDGVDGKSAYQTAVDGGFDGTEAEFEEYLSGIGDLTQEVADQKSAFYEIAPSTNLYESAQKFKAAGVASSSTVIESGSHGFYFWIPIESERGTITISRTNTDRQLRAITTSTQPAVGASIIDYATTNRNFLRITPSVAAKYLAVFYWTDNYTVLPNEAAALEGMTVFYGYEFYPDGISKTDALRNSLDGFKRNDGIKMASVDDAISDIESSLIGLAEYQIGTKNEISISVPNSTQETIKDATLIINLHNYDDADAIKTGNDIYSSLIPKDFRGIKFVDSNGALRSQIVSFGNYKFKKSAKIPSVSNPVLVTSEGYLITRTNANGVRISKNGGTSWNPICGNTSPEIFFVDSNDTLFGFIDSEHSLYRYLKSTDYATPEKVCDMTDVGATSLGMICETDNGYLFTGNYQAEWNGANVYRSTDGGASWEKMHTRTDKQHTHSLTVDRTITPNAVYWGIDDSVSDYGPALMVSHDYGLTWEEVPNPYRDRDYFVYHGENFHIGGGECNILGGVTLYKTSDAMDSDAYYSVIEGEHQGIRVIHSIDGDKVLLVGGCAGKTNQSRSLYLSEDFGETWNTIWQEAPENITDAGLGYRYMNSYDSVTYMGGYGVSNAGVFEYGTKEQSALVYVDVGDVPTGGKTITLETGYLLSVNTALDDFTSANLVADVRFDNSVFIEDQVSHKRVYGDMQSDGLYFDGREIYKPQIESEINLGKLNRLSFNKGFTVCLWVDPQLNYSELMGTGRRQIFKVGSISFVFESNTVGVYNGNTRIAYAAIAEAALWMPGFKHIAVTISNETTPKIRTYAFDAPGSELTASSWGIGNLNASDFIVGREQLDANWTEPYFVDRLKIFDRVLTVNEIRAEWRGHKFI